MDKKIIILLSKFFSLIDEKNKVKTIAVILMSAVASALELISIGLILPILTLFLSPNGNKYIEKIQHYLDYYNINRDYLIFIALIIFIFFQLVTSFFRVFLLSKSTNLAFDLARDFSNRIFFSSITKPYLHHASINSSEVINYITKKIDTLIYNLIFPFFIFTSSIIIGVSIVIFLLYINLFVCLFSLLIYGVFYYLIATYSRNRLIKNSVTISEKVNEISILLQESFAGIRDVLINQSLPFFFKRYDSLNRDLRVSESSNLFFSQFPRYLVETFGILLIILAAFFLLLNGGDVKDVIPTVALFALASQRLMPVLQQGYTAWTNFNGAKQSIQDVFNYLDAGLQCESAYKKVNVIDCPSAVIFNNVSFGYPGTAINILSAINLTIHKGERVGVSGLTGCGKSTFIDLFMGLIEPSGGTILLDGLDLKVLGPESWWSNIAHVSQSIFLLDASIKENIAFGIKSEEIDYVWLAECVRLSCLDQVIADQPNGIHTVVGEAGCKLSGGQRQRIGIARALYTRKKFLVMDEATSALDEITENAVMKLICEFDKNLTILVVAHKESVLKYCDSRLEVASGSIRRII